MTEEGFPGRETPLNPPAPQGVGAADKAAQDFAIHVDKLVGRRAPESPLGDVGGFEIGKIVPNGIRDSEQLKTINQGVSAGALGLAIVGLVLAQGSVAAVTAAGSKAIHNTPTVDSYLAFGQAFWLTLALSLSAAVFVYMLLNGQMKSYGSVVAWIVATLVIVMILQSEGLNGPTVDQLLAEMNATSSNPIAKGFALMGGFAKYYTLLPFIGGAITGSATGWIVHRLEHPVAPVTGL